MPWITGLFRRRRPHRLQYHVMLPDGTNRMFDLESSTTIIQLLEVSLLSMSVPSSHHEMFCVLSPTAINQDDRRWLRLERSLKKELKGLLLPVTLHIQVLFYPRDHYSISHRVAKHLLYSQVKADIGDGKLKCTGEVSVQLAGLVAQAELGNYSEVTLQESYMSQLNLIQMSPKHEIQAIEQHKIRRGMNMDECIDEFLSIAETLKGYGTQKFDVHDDHDRPASLACGPLGVEVLMGAIQTIQLHWESITTINVHNRIINFQTESSYNQTGHLYSFRCFSTRLCKNIAVLCVSMRNFYCNSEVFRPPSKLKRLFSARIPRQRSTQRNIHRNGSTVSSASANPRFRRHGSAKTSSSFYSNRRPLREHRRTPSTPTTTTTPFTAPHTRNSSNSSFNAPLIDTERDHHSSPTSPESPSLRVLPTLEESVSAAPKSNVTVVPPRKSSTLPARVDPAEIMNFSSLGDRHTTQNHHAQSSNRKSSDTGRASNGYLSQNGLIDNFDCINELLDEGLEGSSNRRREGTVTGGEVDRRRVFPRENGAPSYTNRSYTLQNPKRYGERRTSQSSRPYHRSTDSDPVKHYYSSTSLYSTNYNNGGVASMANQLSLATLSQDSNYIDPHIKSLVFDCSQTDATEL